MRLVFSCLLIKSAPLVFLRNPQGPIDVQRDKQTAKEIAIPLGIRLNPRPSVQLCGLLDYDVVALSYAAGMSATINPVAVRVTLEVILPRVMVNEPPIGILKW